MNSGYYYFLISLGRVQRKAKFVNHWTISVKPISISTDSSLPQISLEINPYPFFSLPSCLGWFRVRKVYIYMPHIEEVFTYVVSLVLNISCTAQPTGLSFLKICTSTTIFPRSPHSETRRLGAGNFEDCLKLLKWVGSKLRMRIAEPRRSPGTCDFWHLS